MAGQIESNSLESKRTELVFKPAIWRGYQQLRRGCRRLSKPPHSATLPPLRPNFCKSISINLPASFPPRYSSGIPFNTSSKRHRRPRCIGLRTLIYHVTPTRYAVFFGAFTLAHGALCAAAIFLRAAAGSILFGVQSPHSGGWSMSTLE